MADQDDQADAPQDRDRPALTFPVRPAKAGFFLFFIEPCHSVGENPTLAIERDMGLVRVDRFAESLVNALSPGIEGALVKYKDKLR